MPIVSVTRLRLRSLIYYPAFMWHSMASARQLKRSPGFLDGLLASEDRLTYWTLTVWQDAMAMRAFRDSDAHKAAMPRLVNWCDEASVARFDQASSELPSCQEAFEHMKAAGRLSKVREPSRAHAAGQLSKTLRPPHPGLRLKPKK